jgi:16S rRNA (cytidine1402-2'-O)-methyltransferase
MKRRDSGDGIRSRRGPRIRQIDEGRESEASLPRERELSAGQELISLEASAGVLSVVATPIGNLRDITLRALDVLKAADLIACEDTRTSRILLQRWGIATELMSLHRFSETRKTKAILDRLESGSNIALISDAGVPAISDPGHRLVRAVREAGFRVVAVPGPSSVTAALSVSGMDCSAFVYLGFAPRKHSQRVAFLRAILLENRPCVFFDTPMRIEATMEAAAGVLGERTVVLARELTKRHEEIITGTAEEICAELSSRDAVKGEIVVVVEGGKKTDPEIDTESAVRSLLEEGLTGKPLADEARLRFGLSKREAYEKFLELKREDEEEE